jgi:hypothetical protein
MPAFITSIVALFHIVGLKKKQIQVDYRIELLMNEHNVDLLFELL